VKAKNFAGALLVAILLALACVKPVIAGIDSWKIVLGVAGLILFVGAGMSRPSEDG
jgi:hypothetical protein